MGIVLVALIVIVVALAIVAKGSPGGGYDRLVSSGIQGKGILLQVASRRTLLAGPTSRRFERRNVLIDIELPGRPPYQLQASPYIPLNLSRDVLPGATVEVRVDPRDPTSFAIVGPGVGLVGASLIPGAPS